LLVRDPEALVYELLDAHADAAELAADLSADPEWAAHLDYLRALQRAGREALAQVLTEDPR
jgi:anti-sigma factor RsiW